MIAGMEHFEAFLSYLNEQAAEMDKASVLNRDLLVAVEKINSKMRKEKTKGCDYFQQDEIASLDLGHKARAYLLLLTRLNRLRVETIDGRIKLPSSVNRHDITKYSILLIQPLLHSN
ncbi:hypothetical protein Patl1_32825 [Pistacia atlantica]|uniref:Uncharacterized protein n=1 Tax=Pistacia atlantica TaxID=434234 RepID=A0ACC1ANR6_9ROSI|nr:hypothetical protein Patl1_32825 [Pistacia atlantica]